MTKFSEDIIGRIKHDHIAPVPRWRFLVKSYVFWGLLAISVFLGSLSFSVIVHITDLDDLGIFNRLHGSLLTSTMMMLPYFWFMSVAIFALVAYYNWKHTKLGYRFKRRWIVLSSVALSVTLGSVLYAFGMGNKIDTIMAKSMPLYGQTKRDARAELWMRPENGLLVGKVVDVDDTESTITIKDGAGQDWEIRESNIKQGAKAVLKKGKIVKIVGKKDGENKFDASEIRRCGNCQHDEDDDDDDDNDSERDERSEEDDRD